MVPDPADSYSMDDPADYYELTYRATRAALWDVFGTATFVLFLVAVGLFGFLALVGNALTLARGGNAGHVLFLAVGAVAFGYAAVRLYGLTRE